MMYFLFIIPLVGAALAYGVPSNRYRPYIVTIAAIGHFWVTLGALSEPILPAAGLWLHLDAPGRVVLLTVSLLFLGCALYAPAYLHLRQDRTNQVFCTCLLLMLAFMSLVAMTQHIGLFWVMLEATTLASGPLIYFNRTPRSIEAAWKYLLLCSVGIALALLGSFFLAYSYLFTGETAPLLFENLLKVAPQLSKPWLHAAFVTLLVGYGAKMGLAPMHTWKPDAYGEAPGIVGALFSGGLTTCAFLAILRFSHILNAAGESAFSGPILIGLGLLSMALAAAFMVYQKDYKRMLAYSSVEHMGILALGIGLGGVGIFGALLHVLANALTKGVLFLSSGNIHRTYGSKSIDEVSGALERLPYSAALFLIGFFAVTGSPPFGPFISEFTILRAAMQTHHYWAGGLYLILLASVFIGMGITVLTMVQGQPSSTAVDNGFRDTVFTVAPIVLLLGLVLMLGIYIPPPLETLLRQAAAFLEVPA